VEEIDAVAGQRRRELQLLLERAGQLEAERGEREGGVARDLWQKSCKTTGIAADARRTGGGRPVVEDHPHAWPPRSVQTVADVERASQDSVDPRAQGIAGAGGMEAGIRGCHQDR
jgi:hypothetical protein